MQIVCLDLEGVLVPEVWINVAAVTGIDDLRLTTRDIADYDELMRHRLAVLERHRIGISEIQSVIAGLRPLDGANRFLADLRAQGPVVILSDTFVEFAAPLMRQLDWPTLFCHRLIVSADGWITGYQLRMRDHKRAAVEAFRTLAFTVIAAGDSYNDTTMLSAADHGILFCAPDVVIKAFPHFPHVTSYDALAGLIDSAKNAA